MNKGGRPRRKPYDATGNTVEQFGQSEADLAAFVGMLAEADLWSATAPDIEPGSEQARGYAEHLCELGAMVAHCIESRDSTMLLRLAKIIDRTPKGAAPAMPPNVATYAKPETVPQRVRRIVAAWNDRTSKPVPIGKLIEMVAQSYGSQAAPKRLDKFVREAVRKSCAASVAMRPPGRPKADK